MAKRTHGTFVVIDGIDGSGKGTLVRAMAGWARQQRLKVFSVVDFEKKHGRLPDITDWRGYDVLITAEPTHSLIGRAIRQELTESNERPYSARAIAEAFALDRYILQQRVVLPALARGMCVFQERSASTSFVYQPLLSARTPLSFVKELDGNTLALQHRPDLLCVLRTDVDEVIRRLARRQKKDKSMFERKAFLQKAQRRFLALWFRQLYQRRGAQVVVIDTGGTVRQSVQRMRAVWQEFQETKRHSRFSAIREE